jgi:predicted dehydrogenase
LERVLVVGFGSMGRRHVRTLHAARPDLRIVVVRSHGEGLVPEHALIERTVSTLDEGLDAAAGAAIIASPSPLHSSQAAVLAAAGCGLLIEKPLASTLPMALDLAAQLGRTEVPVLVGYVLNYTLSGRLFSRCVSSGILGTMLHAQVVAGSYLPGWRPGTDYRATVSSRPELGGGVLLEMSHELEYLQRILGPVSQVQAHLHSSRTLGIAVEDTAQALLLGREGLPVSLHLDFNRHRSERSCAVRGTRGELVWDLSAMSVTWTAAGGRTWSRAFPDDYAFMYSAQTAHFLDCVERDVAPIVTLTQGVEVMKLIGALRESDESGCRVWL